MNEATKRASVLDEGTWQKAEQNMARRERVRLIKIGRIRFASPPNVLVPVDGDWRFPSLRAA